MTRENCYHRKMLFVQMFPLLGFSQGAFLSLRLCKQMRFWKCWLMYPFFWPLPTHPNSWEPWLCKKPSQAPKVFFTLSSLWSSRCRHLSHIWAIHFIEPWKWTHSWEVISSSPLPAETRGCDLLGQNVLIIISTPFTLFSPRSMPHPLLSSPRSIAF